MWKIGSRESKLAVIQSEMVKEYLESKGEEASLITMKTTGDKILDRTLDQIGGKGLFVKELDRALLWGETQISVHSLKDMPMEICEDLPIVAYSKREDPRDVLVLPEGCSQLDPIKPIGCSSKRRVIQLKKIFPKAKFQSVRGNVLTRLHKLDQGEYSALVLAAAGLKRLGLEDRIFRYFSTEEVIPSAGQGILAVQGRRERNYDLLKGFHNTESELCAVAERSFVKALDGGCSAPIAAYAELDGEELHMTGLYADLEMNFVRTGTVRGNKRDAKKLGLELAERLRIG